MNTEHTLLNNSFVNSIFDIVKSLSSGLMLIAFVALLGWYGIHYNNSVKFVDHISTHYGINVEYKIYNISTPCTDIMVDAATLNIINEKTKNHASNARCVKLDAHSINKLIGLHKHNGKFFNSSHDKFVYFLLFIAVTSYVMMRSSALVWFNPIAGAIVMVCVWLLVSIVTFPLNFGSHDVSYMYIGSNGGTAFISTAITNDSKTNYISVPHNYLDMLTYVDNTKNVEVFD